jgi:UrcA family protein
MSATLKTCAAALTFAAFAPVAALTLSIAAPAAHAEKAPTGVSVATIEYGDLDISNEAGAKALLSRITQASKKICGKRPTTVMNNVLERHLNCRAEVVKDTVRRINEPTLTFAWQASTGAVVQTASR